MAYLQMVLLSVSLSIDSFVIGVSYGIRKIFVPLFSKIIIAIISFLITSLSLFLGDALLLIIPKVLAQILGPAMLFFLGIFTIFQGLKKQKNDTKKTEKIPDKKNRSIIGVTKKIIETPEYCDFNKSQKIDFSESFYLGVALSIDSVCSGISSAVSGLNSVFLPVLVSLFQFLFLWFGIFSGKKFSSIKSIDEKYFSYISGTILVIVSVIRFFGGT